MQIQNTGNNKKTIFQNSYQIRNKTLALGIQKWIQTIKNIRGKQQYTCNVSWQMCPCFSSKKPHKAVFPLRVCKGRSNCGGLALTAGLPSILGFPLFKSILQIFPLSFLLLPPNSLVTRTAAVPSSHSPVHGGRLLPLETSPAPTSLLWPRT